MSSSRSNHVGLMSLFWNSNVHHLHAQPVSSPPQRFPAETASTTAQHGYMTLIPGTQQSHGLPVSTPGLGSRMQAAYYLLLIPYLPSVVARRIQESWRGQCQDSRPHFPRLKTQTLEKLRSWQRWKCAVPGCSNKFRFAIA